MAEDGTETLSKQPRRRTARDELPFVWTLFETYVEDVPPWGDLPRLGERARRLREFARAEPILAGAVASMTSKVVSLDWQIIGGRNRVRRYHEILAEAEDGTGWSYFIDRWMQDYLTTDGGGFVELARDGTSGPVAALYNLDSACVFPTGNARVPYRYYSSIGDRAIPLYPNDFALAVDLPSPDESKLGIGFCAVSRALKAARVLLALYSYDEEQLSDLPPKGLATITGLTQSEVMEAFKLYDAQRREKRQTTFKGVLWLAALANPLQQIDVKLTPFSTLPDHFDRERAVTLYVYTLALDFGVDVREFWPASQTGATKAEAEIQAQKAKGKGFGRALMAIEREINWKILPPGLQFSFDQKDSEDDLVRETIRARVIENVRRLWEPSPATGTGIISTEEARRLLAEAQAVPNWLELSDESVAYGTENEPDKGEPVEVERLIDAEIAALAEKARLGIDEDLVAINHIGDIITLKAARRTFPVAVPNWPLPARVPFP